MSKINATPINKMENFFLNHIKEPVLELGCGQGYNLNYLKQNGFNDLTGVDLNENLIKEASKFYPSINFYEQDIVERTLKRKYNTIILFEVIEHIQETNKLIENIKEMLSNNGKILLTTPNVLSLRNRVNFLFGNGNLFIQETDSPHITFFSPETLKQKLEQHGLKVIDYFIKSRIPLLPVNLNGTITFIVMKGGSKNAKL